MLRLLMALSLTIAAIAGCSSTYQQVPSANHGHRVKSLVLHFTTVDYAESLHALTAPGGLSAHYLVTRSGDNSAPHQDARVIQLVDEADRAWHAGESSWQHRSRLNDHSIGIEIVYSPHCRSLNHPAHDEQLCSFPDYDPDQIHQLITLIRAILARNPDIKPTAIVGHSDIAFNRKMDPGPRFPWQQLYQAGIGAWYDDDTMTALWTRFRQVSLPLTLLQQALVDYGYHLSITGQLDEPTRNALAAFQMHFVPWQVSARPDAATAAAVMALLQKYMPDKYERLQARYEQIKATPAYTHPLPAGLIDTTIRQPTHFVLSRLQAGNSLTLNALGTGEIRLQLNQQTLLSQQLTTGQTLVIPLTLPDAPALLTVDTRTPVQLNLDYSTVTPVNNTTDSGSSSKQPTVIRGRYYGSPSEPVPAALQNTIALLHALSRSDSDLLTPVHRLLPYFQGNGRSRCTIGDLLSQHCGGYGLAPLVTTESASGTVRHVPAMWQQVVPADALQAEVADVDGPEVQAPVSAVVAQLVNALTQQPPAVVIRQAYRNIPPTLPVLLHTLINRGGYGANQIYTPQLARQLSQSAPVPPQISQFASPASLWLPILSGGIFADPDAGLSIWLPEKKSGSKPDNLYLQNIYRN